jgi:hypothetical protein
VIISVIAIVIDDSYSVIDIGLELYFLILAIFIVVCVYTNNVI